MQGSMGKVLVTALLLGFVGCANHNHLVVEQGVVKVIRVKGMARYSIEHQKWLPVEKGISSRPGLVVQTGPKSLVDFCLNDGHPSFPRNGSERTSDHLIRLFENSALRINRLTKEESRDQLSEDIELDLRAGQIMGTIGTLSPKSKYEVIIPVGQVTVFGGTYMVNSAGVVNVLEGTAVADIKNADKSETRVEIHKGESFDPATKTLTRLTEDQVKLVFPFPETLVCGSTPIPTTNSPSTLGVPRGTGMGGALRKF